MVEEIFYFIIPWFDFKASLVRHLNKQSMQKLIPQLQLAVMPQQ